MGRFRFKWKSCAEPGPLITKGGASLPSLSQHSGLVIFFRLKRVQSRLKPAGNPGRQGKSRSDEVFPPFTEQLLLDLEPEG
jgi:hypothetical protein